MRDNPTSSTTYWARADILRQSRCSPEFFDGQDLFGRLGHGWGFYQQFVSPYEQQEHFAEFQELWMVDVPAVDHSRPPIPYLVTILMPAGYREPKGKDYLKITARCAPKSRPDRR